VNQLLGAKQGKQFAEIFGFKDEGNFHDEASRQLTAKNIPYLKTKLSRYAKKNDIDLESLNKTIEKNRLTLFNQREHRIHPLKDNKILTDWNGLMIAALANGGKILKDDAYTNAAEKAANFILTNLKDDDGRLFKRYRNGSAGLQPHIDDYAFFIWALLDLYETSFDTHYLRSAIDLAETMVSDFLDKESGGFFIGPENGEKLIVRAKDSYDGAIPSGNAIAAMSCTRISKFTGNTKWEDIAQNTFLAFSEGINRVPSAHSSMLTSFMFGQENPKEIVVVAKEKSPEAITLVREIQDIYSPHSIIIFKELNNDAELDKIAPWTSMHDTIDGKITFYVCENFACKRPTTDLNTAIKYLQ